MSANYEITTLVEREAHMNIALTAGNLVRSIRLPLTLAGFCLFIFYLILDKILSLETFRSVLSERHNFDLLSKIINFMFILSMAALVLGMLSYILSQVLPRGRRSSLKIGVPTIVAADSAIRSTPNKTPSKKPKAPSAEGL